MAVSVDTIPNRNSRPAVLLREAWIEGSRIRRRTLANLSKAPTELVAGLRALVKGGLVVSGIDQVLNIRRSLPSRPCGRGAGHCTQAGSGGNPGSPVQSDAQSRDGRGDLPSCRAGFEACLCTTRVVQHRVFESGCAAGSRRSARKRDAGQAGLAPGASAVDRAESGEPALGRGLVASPRCDLQLRRGPGLSAGVRSHLAGVRDPSAGAFDPVPVDVEPGPAPRSVPRQAGKPAPSASRRAEQQPVHSAGIPVDQLRGVRGHRHRIPPSGAASQLL